MLPDHVTISDKFTNIDVFERSDGVVYIALESDTSFLLLPYENGAVGDVVHIQDDSGTTLANLEFGGADVINVSDGSFVNFDCVKEYQSSSGDSFDRVFVIDKQKRAINVVDVFNPFAGNVFARLLKIDTTVFAGSGSLIQEILHMEVNDLHVVLVLLVTTSSGDTELWVVRASSQQGFCNGGALGGLGVDDSVKINFTVSEDASHISVSGFTTLESDASERTGLGILDRENQQFVLVNTVNFEDVTAVISIADYFESDEAVVGLLLRQEVSGDDHFGIYLIRAKHGGFSKLVYNSGSVSADEALNSKLVNLIRPAGALIFNDQSSESITNIMLFLDVGILGDGSSNLTFLSRTDLGL